MYAWCIFRYSFGNGWLWIWRRSFFNHHFVSWFNVKDNLSYATLRRVMKFFVNDLDQPDSVDSAAHKLNLDGFEQTFSANQDLISAHSTVVCTITTTSQCGSGLWAYSSFLTSSTMTHWFSSFSAPLLSLFFSSTQITTTFCFDVSLVHYNILLVSSDNSRHGKLWSMVISPANRKPSVCPRRHGLCTSTQSVRVSRTPASGEETRKR